MPPPCAPSLASGATAAAMRSCCRAGAMMSGPAWRKCSRPGPQRRRPGREPRPQALAACGAASHNRKGRRHLPEGEMPMAFDAFALILAMLGLGMLFARLRALPDNAAETLNKVVLYVCLPAAVLTY